MMNVAVIPARIGSKRLPRKNSLMFHGKPIIAYSIEVAKRSGLFDMVIVSTDDAGIRDIAEEYGAEAWRRPTYLADDVSGTPAVTASVLWDLNYARDLYPEHLCCIYPCAPMIAVEDLHAGYELLVDGANIQRGVEFTFAMGTEPPKDAGQWYWGTADAWRNESPLISPTTVMVPIPEHRCVDINTLEDFEKAKVMYAALHAT